VIGDPRALVELANTKMPFGKYQGQLLLNLPERYLIWILDKEIANGKLASQLEQMMSIKLNGLESILEPLINRRY